MADNYLEKKFEEYRAKKAASNRKTRLTPSGNKPGTLTVKFPCRRVFVTGGASGIGKAIVSAFANAGCRVAFCDCDEQAGRQTAETTGSQFHPLDVADADALAQCMNRLFRAWGDIDIVINNVGISRQQDIADTSIDDFDRIVAVNLRSAFVTAKMLAEHRRSLPAENPFGRIINICSTRYLMSEPGWECYAASKGGIHSLTHALAASLSPLRITVNAISPGWIQTSGYESLFERDHEQHLSRRVGQPDDIARICLFLCLPENDFVNGENIVADGGMTRKMIYEE